ncbi:UNVERIFIED_CONTAM: hypothetical protein K2H54_052674 [Gekko kuhli]
MPLAHQMAIKILVVQGRNRVESAQHPLLQKPNDPWSAESTEESTSFYKSEDMKSGGSTGRRGDGVRGGAPNAAEGVDLGRDWDRSWRANGGGVRRWRSRRRVTAIAELLVEMTGVVYIINGSRSTPGSMEKLAGFDVRESLTSNPIGTGRSIIWIRRSPMGVYHSWKETGMAPSQFATSGRQTNTYPMVGTDGHQGMEPTNPRGALVLR